MNRALFVRIWVNLSDVSILVNSVLYAVFMTQVPGKSVRAEQSVGFIGLGKMGLPMALNYLKADIGSLRVTGRSRDRAADALEAGAVWVATPRQLADACSIIIIMVPDMPQVEELLFGRDAVSSSGSSATVVVCSSVSPIGIREVAERLSVATSGRMTIVDAPVSGGTEGAIAATLSIMVGGDIDSVQSVFPVLATFGTPVHLGPLGSGEIAKACNQLIVAATISAISEASVIAERSGLDLEALLSLLQGGYAGSRVLETKKQRIIDGDYTPTGIARYMVKDLGFAAAAASATDTATPVLDVLRASFEGLVSAGLGDLDLAVVHRYIQSLPRD
ncbi:2-hydroxy-3-oxopropionate reductase [Frigoribacterium sp. UYMn621]